MSRNVDWTTFGVIFKPGAQNVSLNNEATIASITIPYAGKYAFLAVAGASGGNADSYSTWTIKKNGNVIGQGFTTTAAPNTTSRPHNAIACESQCSKNDIIAFTLIVPGNNSTTLERPNGLFAFRIG